VDVVLCLLERLDTSSTNRPTGIPPTPTRKTGRTRFAQYAANVYGWRSFTEADIACRQLSCAKHSECVLARLAATLIHVFGEVLGIGPDAHQEA
jgi:hypothetical protein